MNVEGGCGSSFRCACGTWAPGTAEDAARHLDQLHAAFPGKLIMISEYGYCACTPDRPEGDEPRIEILRTHDAAFRSKDFVGGAIFFCYNALTSEIEAPESFNREYTASSMFTASGRSPTKFFGKS
jgi:hypothetical protein